MQRVYIDLDLDPRFARSALTGLQLASLTGILGDPLNVEVVFHNSGTLKRLANGSTGLFTIKLPHARDDDPLFSDLTMSEVAITSPDGYAYRFNGILDTNELIGAVGPSLDQVDLRCCVAWTEPDEDEFRCADFVFTLLNSSRRPSDKLPARASKIIVTNNTIEVLCPDGQWRFWDLMNKQ